MNRYVAAGLLDDLRAGKVVVYVAERQADARAALEQLSRETDVTERVLRSSGCESIEQREGAGRILFVGAARRLAMSADVLVIDCEPTDAQLENLVPTVAARGELIRF